MAIIKEITQVTVEEGDTEILIQTIPDETIPGSYVTSHGSLTGLADNDHPQYLLRSEAVVTAAEVKTLYESNNNTNAFTDADEAKLDGIEPNATQDQSAAEIKTLYENNANTNAFTDAEKTLVANLNSTGEERGAVFTANGDGTSDYGILVWKDLIGSYEPDSGASTPSRSTFIGSNIEVYAYGDGDAGDFMFHVPHDYAVGTDIHLHIHWGHNGTGITGDVTFNIEATYAPRTDGTTTAFSTPITTVVQESAVVIGNFPQYCHAVTEIPFSIAGGDATAGAGKLNTAALSVDGIIHVHIERNDAGGTNPVITGSSPADVIFVHTVDIHYQADIIGTKNKDPDFYT